MKKSTITISLLLVFLQLNAQSHFSVGVSTAPVYYHTIDPRTNFLIIGYDSFNHNQFSISSGLSIDYAINNHWSTSLRFNYFARNFYNDCMDSTGPVIRAITSYGTDYFKSSKNCFFIEKTAYGFIELPLLVRYTFNHERKAKFQSYISVGNAFIYKVKVHRMITDNQNPKRVIEINQQKGFFSLLSPMIMGGYDYNLNKKWAFFNEFYAKMENQEYQKELKTYNYTLGMTFGIKRRL